MLRQFPVDLYERFKGEGNLFPTTVHVLVSAVVKMSRAIRFRSGLQLYRGLGGVTELHNSLKSMDELGRRGYMEWGFTSTTSAKHIALQVR